MANEISKFEPETVTLELDTLVRVASTSYNSKYAANVPVVELTPKVIVKALGVPTIVRVSLVLTLKVKLALGRKVTDELVQVFPS